MMKKQLLLLLTSLLFLCSFESTTAQVNEGDTLQFWSVSYVDWPPLWGQPQHVVNAICRKAGAHCYVFVEDQASGYDPAALTALVNQFDNNYYPQLTAKYGPVPNALDQDSAIFILALNENNWAGYFDPGQQMTDSLVMAKWNRHSTEREIIYVAANYINYAQSIVAHEFGHLLHWRGDHSPEPPVNPLKYWEEAWVDEGFSTFAAMYLTENINQPNVPMGAYFNSNPDIPLIWFSSYNQVQLFMLFMYEHFGNWNYINSLINNPLNGIPGVESTLNSLGYTEHFDDAFEQFALTNYIDDPLYQNGKYSCYHYDYNNCSLAGNHSAIPTGLKTGNTTAYGVDYVAFNSITPKPVTIDFNGDDNGKFRLAFIQMNTATNTIYNVSSVIPDSLNNAHFEADSLGYNYNRVVMVVMNIDSTVHEGQSTPYTYSAAILTDAGVMETSAAIQVFPNPANRMIYFESGNAGESIYNLEINNMFGQVVVHIPDFNIRNGLDIHHLAPGMYTLNLEDSTASLRRTFIKN